MNSKLSPWFSPLLALMILSVLACILLLSVFTALTPSFALFLIGPTAPASPLEPTLQPTPGIKCPNGDCANACLSQLTSIVRADGLPGSPAKSTIKHDQGLQPVLLVTYRLNGDQLLAAQFAPDIPSNLSAYQQDVDPQKKIWSYFAAIIPSDQRRELVAYIVSTDGRGAMLASVEQSSSQPQSWALNVDIADAAQPRDLTYTLLHEFGHLLTLNAAQVTPDAKFLAQPDDLQIYQQEAAACPQFFASGGCSQPGSYINRFFNEFWPKLYGEWNKVNLARNHGDYSSLLAHFYAAHPTQFITPYAATSPEEDIAESWAYFVLTSKPADDSLAHRKVLFFYKFPELVALRKQIIYGICNYASTQ